MPASTRITNISALVLAQRFGRNSIALLQTQPAAFKPVAAADHDITMADVEATSAATPVQVKFTGITLDVKTGKDQTKRILDDVSGHFGPAESVAVMGVGPRRFTPAM